MTALAEARKQIESQFGEGSVMELGSKKTLDVEAISTGSLALDNALGIGGVPRGRLVEIVGPESSGKTTLAYHILANAQASSGICAFIDTEHAIDPGYAKAIGVDTKKLLISQPDYGEQALEIATRLVETGDLAVVAIDSVDACTPRVVLEGEIGESTVGLLARLMSQACRKLAPAANRTRTCVVFTNQIRENINTLGYGPKETQPGGRALKFYAGQRIDLRRIATMKDGEEAVGNRVKAKVVKNKVAAPLREAEFELDYGIGVSKEGELIDFGIALGLIKKKGSWFSYGDQSLGQGRENVKQTLRTTPELTEKLEEQIRNGEAG